MIDTNFYISVVIEAEEPIQVYLPREGVRETAQKLARVTGCRVRLEEVYEPEQVSWIVKTPTIQNEFFVQRLQALCANIETPPQHGAGRREISRYTSEWELVNPSVIVQEFDEWKHNAP